MHMLAVLSRLAWRNLWRNHRRTLIMLLAITLGTWAMIFMTALMRGMVSQMVSDGISALPGHVQVHHPDYRDDPSVANLINVPDSEIAKRFEGAGFRQWASRVRVPAVITSEYDSRGVTLIGVDPALEDGMTFVDYDEVEGRFLESPGDQGVVIGRKLANTLNTEVGKRIVLMSQDPDNDIDGDTVVVGAANEDSAGGDAGSAYVFEYSGGVWTQTQQLTGDDFIVDNLSDGDSGAIRAFDESDLTIVACTFAGNDGDGGIGAPPGDPDRDYATAFEFFAEN